VTTVVFIVCPHCGMNRILEKTGLEALRGGKSISFPYNGRIRFDFFRPDMPFVDLREANGKGGFPRYNYVSFEKAREFDGVKDLLDQIKLSCKGILKVLKD